MKTTKVIVVGAGPAGIACAIQLKRNDIDSIIFERESVGGLLKNANLIENYPGFPNGITGEYFVKLLEKQININQLNIVSENVESIENIDNSFTVYSDKNNYKSEYIVIASGTKPLIPKYLDDKIGKQIFTDIYNIGEVKNKEIGIIGAGDCAFDYALNLCSNNKIVILNRGHRIKALPILQKRVFSKTNIKYLEHTVVDKIDIETDKIMLKYDSNKERDKFDYLLVAVGREPCVDFIDAKLLNNQKLFMIGDVKNSRFRQSSIAIGDGTFTAMEISSILTKE